MAESLPRRRATSTVGDALNGVLRGAGMRPEAGRGVVFAKMFLGMYETPVSREKLNLSGWHALLFAFLSKAHGPDSTARFQLSTVCRDLGIEARWGRRAWKLLKDDGWIQDTGRMERGWKVYAWGPTLHEMHDSSVRMRKL